MKTELVQFYVTDDALPLYGGSNYAKSDRRLGLYLGEDDEHVWVYPLILGAVQGDPNQTPRIVIGSVMRFIRDTVVLQEPDDFTSGTFGDMIYHGESLLS